METITELSEPDVYSQDGDTVTLTISAEEFRHLVEIMGRAVASFERAGDHHMALTAIAVHNFLQRGNRGFLPIPRC
jgi:hypothetical protein